MSLRLVSIRLENKPPYSPIQFNTIDTPTSVVPHSCKHRAELAKAEGKAPLERFSVLFNTSLQLQLPFQSWPWKWQQEALYCWAAVPALGNVSKAEIVTQRIQAALLLLASRENLF